MNTVHGGNNACPQRECVCGHTRHIHSRGPCGLSGGRCDCQEFTDKAPVALGTFDPVSLFLKKKVGNRYDT